MTESPPKAPEASKIQRSELSVLAWQLRGLHQGLLDVQAKEVGVGKQTVALVRKLDQDVRELFSGRGVLQEPHWDDMTFGDLIARTAILNSTIAIYLDPDELEAQRNAIRF